MEERIALCALHHYNNVLPLTKGKPKETEWTVYSAIVAVEEQNKDSKHAAERLWVVSCATGTKCATFVPPIDASSVVGKFDVETTILRDCHAEALARRGLLRVLWQEIKRYQMEPSNVIQFNNRLLDTSNDSTVPDPKLVLRSNISLHLYVSDPPCGDACIYPLLDKTSREVRYHNSRSLSKKSNPTHDINFTGAKVIVSPLSGVNAQDCGGNCQLLTGYPANYGRAISTDFRIVVARENVQLLNKLRTKSGHSKLPLNMRSACMSCSDKLVRWCVLGLQGSVLSTCIPVAIRLKSIVTSYDLHALSKLDQEEALSRATRRRILSTLKYLQEYDQFPTSGDRVEGPTVHVVNPRFARGKTLPEYESSNSRADADFPQSQKRKRSSVSPCGICLNWDQTLGNGCVEQIVGARGTLQGKKPKHFRDFQTMASPLSRAMLRDQAAWVLSKTGKGYKEGEDLEAPLSYKKWKESHSDATYQRIRCIIFAGGPLAGWLTSS